MNVCSGDPARKDTLLCLFGRRCNYAHPGEPLRVTHKAIAAELGSAREVVSRVLKELEREGAVVLGRGHIELADPALLRRLAAPHT